MSPTEIHLIKTSFGRIEQCGLEAGRVFYEELFKSAPHVRELFPNPIDEQAKKLFNTVALAVSKIDTLDDLDDTLALLGQKHAKLGVTSDGYVIVGETLIVTLAVMLGDLFDDQTQIAWKRFYNMIATKMQAA